MAVIIKSDGQWRNLLYGYELPKKQRKEFNYMADEEYDTSNFAKYRGHYYDINEFSVINNRMGYAEFKGWDGIVSDSYFSGVLIKLNSDGEKYKIGHYIS